MQYGHFVVRQFADPDILRDFARHFQVVHFQSPPRTIDFYDSTAVVKNFAISTVMVIQR